MSPYLGGFCACQVELRGIAPAMRAEIQRMTFSQSYKAIPRPQAAVLVALATLLVAAIITALWWRTANSEIAPTRFVTPLGDISEMRYSPDGRMLMAVDSEGGAVTFYDSETGRVVRHWQTDGGAARLSSDGSRVLQEQCYPLGHAKVILRDAITGRVLRTWPGRIFTVQPDFSLMVTEDDYLPLPEQIHGPRRGHVIAPATGREIGSFPIGQATWASLSRDGRFLCLPAFDGPARLLRLPSLTPALPTVVFPKLMALLVRDDDSTAIGASRDGTLHFWSLPDGAHRAVSTDMPYIDTAFLLGNGGICLQGYMGRGASRRNVLEVRSSDGARRLYLFSGEPRAYSADRRYVATQIWEYSSQNSCDLDNLITGKRIARLDTTIDPLGNHIWNHNAPSAAMAVSRDGRRCAYAASNGLLRLYDLRHPAPRPNYFISRSTGRVVQPLNDGPQSDPSDPMQAGNFTGYALPCGGVQVIPSPQNLDTLPFPMRNWPGFQMHHRLHKTVRGTRYELSTFSVSPDGKVVAIAWQRLQVTVNNRATEESMEPDGQADLRDARTGALLRTLPANAAGPSQRDRDGYLSKPIFSADSALVAVPAQNDIRIYAVTTGHEVGRIAGLSANYPDGYREIYEGPDSLISRCAFSSDNRCLAAVRSDGAIYLYSLSTFLPIAQIGQTPYLIPTDHGCQAAPLRWMEFDAHRAKLYGIPMNGTDLLEWDAPTG